MTLPSGVERREFDGETALATHGPPVYGEDTTDGWRRWDPHRSKLAAILDRNVDIGLESGTTVLYLGAAAGTTVSHLADVTGSIYAIEFAPRPMLDLVDVAIDRDSILPLLKDARRPATYAHIVEPVDVLIQDVATRGQARVALENRQFLKDGGRLILAVKARSEDVTEAPETVFDRVLSELESGYEVLASDRLDPLHDDHLWIVARPR